MIIGKIKDLRRYKGLSKNIDTAIDFVLNNDILSMSPGKYSIDGSDVVLNRDSYVARELKDCFYENHDNFLDLQIVFKGKELFGYTDISDPTLIVTSPYNAEKDLTKYSCKNGIDFVLEDGFALVYPEDIHQPKCKINDEIVEKAVIKIKIEK